jgi:phosphoglycerol transferase MdoB-like AlkP superfamily enzyme
MCNKAVRRSLCGVALKKQCLNLIIIVGFALIVAELAFLMKRGFIYLDESIKDSADNINQAENSADITEDESVESVETEEKSSENNENNNEQETEKKPKKGSKVWKFFYYLIPVLLGFIVPVLNFFLIQTYVELDMKNNKLIFLNIVFFELLAWFLIFLTNRIRTGLLIETVITFAFGLIDYFVVKFRSTPILPWDIFSIGTAMNVAGSYQFELSDQAKKTTIYFIIIILALVMMMFIYHKEKISKKIKARVISIVVSFVALATFTVNLQRDAVMEWADYYPYQFTPLVMMKRNGIAATMVYDFKYLTVQKPDGYSEDEAEEILESYEEETTETDEDLPNVIAIMNESWSDLSVLSGDLNTSEEVMPFISSLMDGAENTISGNCHVSIVGGNTANSEFEFITGNTMKFMPDGSIPYMCYIKEGAPSLISHMNELGYDSYFLHPNTPSAWNREKVYTNFGVDNILLRDLDGDDTLTTQIEKLRNYTTDQAVFDRIENLFEEKSDDSPLFTWAVTIQNHGAYSTEYSDCVPYITVDGSDSYALSNYLSLVNRTDKAFEQLVEYFENYDEKTIIVMFGDHQPNDVVASAAYKANGESLSGLSTDELKNRYITPYVIWANYDIEEATDVDTSANYLAAQTLKAAGIPCSDYQNYLLDLAEELPVLSSAVMIDSDGNDVTDNESEYQELLNEYRKLAYYRMFDSKVSD